MEDRKVVLITGCSEGGIGYHLAKCFAEDSVPHRVFASARSLDKMRTLPPNVERVRLDVTDEESVQEAVKEVIRDAGKIDILINNAGANTALGPTVEVPLHQIKRTFEVNVFGLIRVTQAVAAHMIPRRAGTIVNVGSTAGLHGLPFSGPYSASKSAVHVFSDSLRLELSGFGINVVVVAPGRIRSNIGDTGEANIVFPEKSFYSDVQDLVLRRAQFSQGPGSQPTNEFAALVKAAVVKSQPRAYVIAGPSALLSLVGYHIPSWIRDIFVGRMFSTWRIGRTQGQ